MGQNILPLVYIEKAPVWCSGLCHTRASALELATAPISLVFCHDCGHLFNQEYQPVQYGRDYDSSLDFSSVFQSYAENLADMLVQRYSLHGKTIVEIGCGRGDFLRMLCSRGANRGIGFDPSYPAEMPSEIGPAVSIKRENFPGYRHNQMDADLVCSRHVLEHIGDPRSFISTLRDGLRALQTPVFFEVPNSLYTLRDGGVWDVIYEHHSFFSPSSLARLFWECGFEPVEVEETYAGQFLTIHAMTGRGTGALSIVCPEALNRTVEAFSQNYQAKIGFWKGQLNALDKAKAKAVAWGAGAKTTMFLNLLRPSSIDHVVDVNPRKWGKFMIGTGQQIVAPEFLKDYCPTLVLLTNGYYASEVRQTLSGLGLTPELLVV
jgi:SAM-dependent methyltransferase